MNNSIFLNVMTTKGVLNFAGSSSNKEMFNEIL